MRFYAVVSVWKNAQSELSEIACGSGGGELPNEYNTARSLKVPDLGIAKYVAVAAFLLALWGFYVQYSLGRDGEHAEAVVTEIQPERFGPKVYLSFTHSSGNTIAFSINGFFYFNSLRRGDVVPIIHDVREPWVAAIDDWRRWVWSFVFTAIGIGAVVYWKLGLEDA